jgi:signal transduction histidine kinase
VVEPTHSRVPTTAAGVELAMLIAFLGVRALNLLQIGVAAAWGLPHSPRPWLDAACMLGWTAVSVFVATRTLRRGGHSDRALVVLDVAAAAAISLLQADFANVDDRINSWGGWAFPVAISAAFGAGLALRRIAAVAAVVVVLSGCFLSTTLVPADTAGQRITVVVNSLAIAAFAAVAMAAARFLRRLGADSDAARASAAEAAAAAELDRHRLLLHDQETVLRLLSEPVLDPALAALLQKQAASGASRIRSFLDGSPLPADGDRSLAGRVRFAAAQFTDLPLTVSTDLAADVPLAPEAVEPLEQAVVTLLHNVRRHARATSVVVHAAVDEQDGWEVSVHDNGRGFDPACTPRGFGLSRQVEAALAPYGIVAEVETVVGDGTLVVLRYDPNAVSA